MKWKMRNNNNKNNNKFEREIERKNGHNRRTLILFRCLGSFVFVCFSSIFLFILCEYAPRILLTHFENCQLGMDAMLMCWDVMQISTSKNESISSSGDNVSSDLYASMVTDVFLTAYSSISYALRGNWYSIHSRMNKRANTRRVGTTVNEIEMSMLKRRMTNLMQSI